MCCGHTREIELPSDRGTSPTYPSHANLHSRSVPVREVHKCAFVCTCVERDARTKDAQTKVNMFRVHLLGKENCKGCLCSTTYVRQRNILTFNCTHVLRHKFQPLATRMVVAPFLGAMLLLLACHVSLLTIADNVDDCTFEIQRVTQTSISCRRPVIGLPPVSGADCLKFVLRPNANLTNFCEATTMCRRETCATCDSITRIPTCRDKLAGPGVSISCIAGSEVRTQTLCNCRCYEYLYMITEERECWELAAFSNTTASAPFISTLCSDAACVLNFTHRYAEGTRLPIIGCIMDIVKSSSSASNGVSGVSDICSSSTGIAQPSNIDPTLQTTAPFDSAATTSCNDTLMLLMLLTSSILFVRA